MKLYEVVRNTRIRIVSENPNTPPSSNFATINQEFMFHTLDGAYSYCIGADGLVYHLHATTEVEVLE